MEKEPDMRQIMQLLLSRWKLIAVIVILAVLAGAAFTQYTYVPRYKTTSTLIVMIRTEQVRNDQIYDVRLSRDMVETIERFATSRLVLDEVIEQVGHGLGHEALRENIEIEQYAGTEFLEIAVTDRDPARAVDTANELAAVLVDQLVDYMEVNNMRLVDAAVTAELIPPQTMRNLTAALVLGLMLGIGLVFLRDALDNTLKTPEEVQEQLQLPVLGTVQQFEHKGKREKG